MVIDFSYSLERALLRIGFIDSVEFLTSDEIAYADAKWLVVGAISQLYADSFVACGLRVPDLYNWLFERKDDEVSYFICEAGANLLRYGGLSGSVVRVYFGRYGFVVSIEQVLSSFDAVMVDSGGIKENLGGGFSFFRDCSGVVFFDVPRSAKCVYYAYFFE